MKILNKIFNIIKTALANLKSDSQINRRNFDSSQVMTLLTTNMKRHVEEPRISELETSAFQTQYQSGAIHSNF